MRMRLQGRHRGARRLHGRRGLAGIALAGCTALYAALLPALAAAATPAQPGAAKAARPAPEPPVLVYAAASLQESLDAVAAAWTARSGQAVKISYAGSGTLARQIDRGAPADVFFSADRAWMDWLTERGRIAPDSRRDLLGNTLVLVAPAATARQALPLTADGLRHALGADGRLAMADTGGVPAGRYGKESLQTLGLWPAVSGRLAEADDVRGALAFVARGEAPLGLVYATDARVERRVRVVARLPARSHAAIVYPVARVRAAPTQRSAGFLQFLGGAEAGRLFSGAGFRRLASPTPPATAERAAPAPGG